VHVESGISTQVVATPGNGDPIFFAAGRKATGEFRCAECGYGAVVRTVLPVCPMCRGLSWEEPAGSPFPN
jgi:rubrerythrin